MNPGDALGAYTISNRAPSATRTTLHIWCSGQYSVSSATRKAFSPDNWGRRSFVRFVGPSRPRRSAQNRRPCHKPRLACAKVAFVPHRNGTMRQFWFEYLLSYLGFCALTTQGTPRNTWHEHDFCTRRRSFVARTAILRMQADPTKSRPSPIVRSAGISTMDGGEFV